MNCREEYAVLLEEIAGVAERIAVRYFRSSALHEEILGFFR